MESVKRGEGSKDTRPYLTNDLVLENQVPHAVPVPISAMRRFS